MIYTVISGINEKDCCEKRQSIASLPRAVERYILDTKNEQTREERLLAYTVLSFSLEKFYGIKEWNIEKNAYGKPNLVTYGEEKNLYINVSHSDGAVAVVLSDEGEVGVDIQAEILPEREDRLKKRFFDFNVAKADDLSVAYLYFDRGGNFSELEMDNPEDIISFTDKWSACEAVMKCDGRGFSSLPELEKIQRNMHLTIKRISFEEKQFSLSIAKKRVVM